MAESYKGFKGVCAMKSYKIYAYMIEGDGLDELYVLHKCAKAYTKIGLKIKAIYYSMLYDHVDCTLRKD